MRTVLFIEGRDALIEGTKISGVPESADIKMAYSINLLFAGHRKLLTQNGIQHTSISLLLNDNRKIQ